jgi:hypothetical protein
MKKAFDHMLWVLGALLSAPALISLVQRMLDIGLVAQFADFVSFYRALMHPVFEVLYAPLRMLFHWSIPHWVQDLQLLAFIGAGAIVRGAMVTDTEEDKGLSATLGYGLFLVFAGLTFFGLAAFLLPVIFLNWKRLREDQRREQLGVAGSMAASLAAVIVFYVSNHLMSR